MGGKTIGDERKRLVTKRQNEAKAAVRRYVDDVTFQVAKDSRDRLRGVQRDLRDHFTAQAEQLKRSLQESLQAAERAVKASTRRAGAPGWPRSSAELEQLDDGAPAGQALLPLPAAGSPARPRERCRPDERTADHRGPPGAAAGHRGLPRRPGDRRAAARASWTGSTSRCGWRSPARSRRASRRCSTRWSASRSRPPTPASAPGSSPGTATGRSPRIVDAPARTARRPPLPVRRRDGALVIDLGGTPAERVDRLVVDWPSQSLRGDHADRHPGHRVAVHGDVAGAPWRFLDPDDDTPDRGRRGDLPDAPPARHRRRVPRVVPRPGRGQGHRGQHRRRDLARRRDRRRAGGRDVLGARRSPSATAPDPTRARAVPERRRGGRAARRRPAARCGRPSSPRWPRWPREPRAELEPQLLLGRPVPARHAADAGRTPRRSCCSRFGLFGVRLSTTLIRQGAQQPGRAGRPSWSRAAACASCSGCCRPSSPSAATCSRPARRCSRWTACCAARSRGGRAAPARSSGSSPARTSSPSCGCSARCGPARSSCRAALRAEAERLLGDAGARAGRAGSGCPPTRRRTSCVRRPSPRWTAGSGTP